MLTERVHIGEWLIFNGRTRACVTEIKNQRVTFVTTLEGCTHTNYGVLNEVVFLAGVIKIKLIEIGDSVKLQIESPKDMVISRTKSF